MVTEDDGPDDEQPDGGSDVGRPMRARVAENRAKLYVFLEADRWIVTVGLLVVVFAVLVTVGAVAPVPLRTLVSAGDPVGTLFQALVTAIITGVTVVVTITQLVLSQELGPLGDQRERMDGAMAFRRETEDLLGTPVSPLEPSRFLQELVEEAGSRAEGLGEAVATGVDDPLRSRVESFVDSVTTDVEQVSDRFEGAQFGNYEVLSPALDFNYSVKIYDARRLRNEHGDDLPAAATESLEDVIEILTSFAPAREHVKTLYFQWELTNLTREILYATVPALVVAMVGVVYLDDPGTIQGATFGIDNLVWTVSAAATVGVAPFALLLAYVLRVATVAKHTLAIGPLVLREVDPATGVDWDDLD